jgi:hypothetical protein
MTTKLALLALVGGLLLTPTAARAQIYYDDDPQLLAPPVRGGAYSSYDSFDWRDLPIGERIDISRACFDQDGYQLFDRRGQSIFVPFEGRNLYVMRFGRTAGRTFFLNDGGIPTLYLPQGGFLDNLIAPGARWFPFPSQFNYVRPVFIGLAPSWNDYCAMGWYPGMTYWGGYWDYQPWRFGSRFAPMNSLNISIGNFSYTRWDDYCDYWRATPARRVIFLDTPGRFGSPRFNRDSRFDRSDRFDRFDRDDRFYTRPEPQKERVVRPGDFDRDRDRFGSSARDRESSRVGGYDDSRFSRSSGFSRPGGFDRNDRGSDRRPTGIGQGGSDRRSSGRAPESRSSSSGRSSRDREARRQ